MTRRRTTIAGLGALVAGAILAPACRDPTEIVVDVTTDVPCDRVRSIAFYAGAPHQIGDDAGARPTCTPDGKLGSIVLAPSGDKNAAVSFRVIERIDLAPDACDPDAPAKGCIVAKRTLKYVPHSPLHLEIALSAACDGVRCAPDATCVDGQCRNEVLDPNQCVDRACTGGDLGDGGAPLPGDDGGADAAGDATLDAGTDAADGAPDAPLPTTFPECVMTGLQAGAAWPMDGYCPAHPWRSPFKAPRVVPRQIWSQPVHAEASIAIAADGTIFVGTTNGLRAFEKSGTLRFQTNQWTDTGLVTTPVIGADGTVYGGCIDASHVCAFDPVTGSPLWNVAPSTGTRRSSLTPDAAGHLYYSDSESNLVAISASATAGAVVWTKKVSLTESVDLGAPAFGADGIVYETTSDARLTKWNVQGTLLDAWTPPLGGVGGTYGFTPSIGGDGRVLFASTAGDAMAYRVGPTSDRVFNLSDTVDSIAMRGDMQVYFHTQGPQVVPYDQDDRGLTPFPSNHGRAIFDVDGVYVYGEGGQLVAYDSVANKELWRFDLTSTTGDLNAVVITADGALVVAKNDDTIALLAP